MDREAVESQGKACKDVARVVIAVAVMFMLIWILQMGYKLATETRTDLQVQGSEYDHYMVLVFGVATVIFGMVYFIIGLTIVAELALDLFAWLQGKDVESTNNQEKEKTIYQVCIQATATIVSMFMLGWAIYHGCKLATGAPKGRLHNCLAFVIGFTAMGFGFIYFIIGISIVAEPALYLSGRLRQKISESHILQDRMTDPLLAV